MTSAARKPPRDPIFGLDLVRFIAALLVVFYHLAFSHYGELVGDGAVATAQLPLPWWWAGTWFGWVGVQIFFVISGLVIAYSLEGATRASFAQSRFARLWPAMLICATIAAAVQIGFRGAPLGHTAFLWFKAIVFAPLGPWIAGQIWTLPVEICFYGLMWLVAVSRPERLVPLAWALALGSAGYWLVVTFGGVVDTFGRLTQLVPLQHGCYFALGMAISWCHRRRTLATGAIIAISLATSVLQIKAAAAAERLPHGVERFWPVAWTCFALATAAILLSVVFRHALARRLSPAAGRTLRWMGLVTYPLYLVHIHVGLPVATLVTRGGGSVPGGVTVGVLLSIAVAAVVAMWLEPPLHRRVKAGVAALLARAGAGHRSGGRGIGSPARDGRA